MEQTKALNALAPFLALSKSASSPRQAADIVSQATSAQNTYVFAELLQTPAIQSLRNDSQHGGHYKLLEIFTWGTWADYQALAASLPQLTEAQSHKLRVLSLLSLASTTTNPSDLSYPHLTRALGLSSARELESLVTAAIYADLLRAVLDSAQELVIISSVAPLRDLAPGSATAMAVELDAWAVRCEEVSSDLKGRMDGVRIQAEQRSRSEREKAKQRERAEEKYVGAKNGEKEGGDSGRTLRARVAGAGEGDAMDVDSMGAGSGGGGAKKKKWFGRK